MLKSVITYNVFHHVAWGTSISVYFWLVGISAGAFLISSLSSVFNIKRYEPIALTSTITAILVLLIVPILLIWDLGQPLRFLYLLIPSYWHYSGPMSWGSALIILYSIAIIIYCYFLIKHNKPGAKVVGIICLILVVSLEWYTGVVMQLNPGRFLNHTSLTPLLFLAGAFISGIGFVILVLWIQNMVVEIKNRIEWKLIEEMAKYMMYGLVFDAFLLFLDFMNTLYGNENEVMGHEVVLMDVFRFSYLWLELLIGLIIPFFILVSPLKKFKAGVVLAALLVVVGVYGMRVWWVMGGQYLQTFY